MIRMYFLAPSLDRMCHFVVWVDKREPTASGRDNERTKTITRWDKDERRDARIVGHSLHAYRLIVDFDFDTEYILAML